jgi:hypothetical protein
MMCWCGDRAADIHFHGRSTLADEFLSHRIGAGEF